MKRAAKIITLVCSLLLSGNVFAAVDQQAISTAVDSIVAGIESGTNAGEFKAEAYEPYAFIMQEDGKMIVHPSLAGQSLKEKAPPVYEALTRATPEGIWVEYEWQGKLKHTYARKTSNNLIVGSGY